MCTPESYTYDAWGNLLTLGANTTTQSNYVGCTQESGFNYTGAIATNNRLAVSGFSYDSAGNMTASPGATYTYDAENHLTATHGVTYAYDGDGKRLTKSSGMMYWYGLNSDPLIETDLSNNLKAHYIFFNGQRVASENSSNSVNWYFADHLGTARLVFSVAGDDQSDFYPFGGERVISTGAGNHYKFTGKERDSESNLDNFGARYMSGTMGRFMTPDWAGVAMAVPYADFGNPQSLNLYTYVGNNPLSRFDIDGHESNWEKFKAAVSQIIVAKTEVGAGVGGATRVGPLAGKIEAKITAALKYEGGEVKTEVAVQASMAVGKSGTMMGPQVNVPILTTDKDGLHTGGEPTIGLTSHTQTSRDHSAVSEVGQAAQGTPTAGGADANGSFPITIGGHAGPLGAEVGIDLAPIPEAASTGLAALMDGINFAGNWALTHAGINPSSPGEEVRHPPQTPTP